MHTKQSSWSRTSSRALQALAILTVGCMASPVSVNAADDPPPQEVSRAQVLAAARAAKATEATPPPERSFLERKLYWYDNQYGSVLFGGWHGFHLAGGDFPAGAGFKFGVGFDHAIGTSDPDPTLPNRVDVTARAAYSTRGYTRVGGGVDFRNLGGAPIGIGVGVQRYEFPQEDFFGLGRDSLESNRTDYLLRSTDVSAAVTWNPKHVVELAAGATYMTPEIGRGTDDRFPSTGQAFLPGTTPGLAAQPDFLRADVSAAIDWRDNPLHPHVGGRYGVVVSQYRDQDFNTFDFRRYEIRLQQYVPLPNRYRLIALRADAVLTDTDSGQQVPFYFQPALGGSQTLRGFREFRFRDRNALNLTAEYRWEAWWAMDVALFVDAGTVAPRPRDLTLKDLDTSYGVGFRLHSNRAFIARLDLARSREGFVPLLRFEHVF